MWREYISNSCLIRVIEMALRSSTKEKILDVAEGLFAEYGFNDTSLRTITSKAGGEPCVGQLPFW
ncbi:hypothetical protein VCA_001406 [Vibrio albensis VL426]|nr:hypothetical protein VCA_001406 [Vibrio cholerae VL426]